MTQKPAQTTYDFLSIGLHWLMAVLIVAAYASIELSEVVSKTSELHQQLQTVHFMLGLSVLALVMIRVVTRLLMRGPVSAASMPKWQRWLAKWVHLALYALMIGMPLLGWLALDAQGYELLVFDMRLPRLVSESQFLAKWVEEIHEAGGTIGYFLIGLHTAAALYHHYLVGDNTLRRMLPIRH